MALLSLIKCLECKEEKHVSHSAGNPPPDVCEDCERIIKLKQRNDFLAKLARLSIEERLSRIEKILYDHADEINRISDITHSFRIIG